MSTNETDGIAWAEVDAWFGREPCIRLSCPLCASSYQHHGDVFAFRREGGEDGPSGVGRPGVAGWEPTEANPSSRRGAVAITFEGECGHRWRLEIVQHKGETFVFARADTSPR